MPWEPSIILLAPEDFIVEGLAELLSRAGFNETGREYKRRGKSRLIIVTGEREDPFHGKETLAVALLRGKPRRDWLEKALSGHGRVVLIALDGLDYGLEGITVLGPEWLAEAFNRYSIEPPRTLLEKFIPERERPEQLKEFVLDGPLVEPVSSQKLVDEAKRVVSYKFSVRPEELKIEGLKLKFRPVYVVSWSRENESGKAFYDGKKLVLNVDGELKGLAMKVLLEDVATVLATEVEVGEETDPAKPVVEEAVRKGWLDLRVLHSRKAYVPEGAVILFSIGPRTVRVSFDFTVGRVSAEGEPLSEEGLVKLAKERVRRELGEEPLALEIVRRGRFTLMRGKTRRYLFEIELNSYSGSVRRFQPALTEEAMLEVVLSKYSDGHVIGVERRPSAVFVDLLAGGRVLVLKLDQKTGEIVDTRDLGSPEEFLRKTAGEILEVVKDLELKSCQVMDHEVVRAEFEGNGLRAYLAYDGETGEILERALEIGSSVAVELAVRKYRSYSVLFTEEVENGFTLTLEGDRDVVKVFVSRSGEIQELDRFLKKEVVEEIALSKIREVEPSPSIEGLKLSDHWEVEFTGVKAFGRLTVHRTSGEVLDFDYQYIESVITKAFTEFVKKSYGDTIEVEWIAHNLEEGYAGIKGVGRRGIYFGKYNTLTGELIEHDFVPGSGITSKFKLAQVEGKYAVK
ncbi:hypothetical protein [Thermococcus nautili]|uniref:Putative type II restriction endonuclease n=1 Tax=Thermococcus nautili TaxID=195522 RepID=W8PK35_9EURY|nr:hypothetical protein [Thermococcus nautili]AHL22454.1 putative type II restriction endonuclease [Thermococcus nautili]